MSKKRKRANRRTNRFESGGSMVGHNLLKWHEGHSPQGAALSPGSELIPISMVFYQPEVAVETFLLKQAARGSHVQQTPHSLSPTLVKGCERRFALEDCGAIRLCTPRYYREDSPSLIWDEQEGSIANPLQVAERLDDPADLESGSQLNGEPAFRGPLTQAVKSVSESNLKVTERTSAHLTYGDNCLIWCTSVKPRTKQEWSTWSDSLEDSYDHVTVIRDPHLFAHALGAMALQQKGLQGNGTSFFNAVTEETIVCGTLPVVYGPVIYTDRRRDYIGEASSDLEFVLRSLFTKTPEHRHQREYRFALLTDHSLPDDTLRLNASEDISSALKHKALPPNAGMEGPFVSFRDCSPSPRILGCLSATTSTEQRGVGHGPSLTGRVQSNLHLAGVEHKRTTTIRRTVETLEDIDQEALETAVAAEPGDPNDARIIKLILDGGPGSVVNLYDMAGLAGSLRIANKSDKAVMTMHFSDPVPSNRETLVDISKFDGTSLVSSSAQRLKLVYTAANPMTRVEHTVSNQEVTRVAITATSEDGSASSSFEIVLDGLSVNARCIELERGDQKLLVQGAAGT